MDRLDQERVLEQIDACRQGTAGQRTDDLRDPALSDLAQAVAENDERAGRMLAQVEAADAAISAALHDVEVPDDLAERLRIRRPALAVARPRGVVRRALQTLGLVRAGWREPGADPGE